MLQKLFASKNSKIIKIDWLETEFLYINNPISFKQFISEKLNKNIPDYIKKAWEKNNGYCVRFDYYGKVYFLMLVKNKDVLLHECIHMVEMILEFKGINPLLRSMAEVRANMTNYIYKLVKGDKR